MTRLGVTAAALGALVIAAGCGERSEPTAERPPLYPVTVEGAGEKPVKLQRRAERIAVLSQGAASILAALGAGDKIVGAPASIAARISPSAVAVVDERGAILLGPLRRARPDLIIASPASPAEQLDRAAVRVRAPVYVTPESSMREVERAISDLGLLAGEPIAARGILAGIEDGRRRVLEATAGRPTVTVFLDTGFFTTVSDRSLTGDLLRTAGGDNVAGSNPPPGPFDLRTLRRRDPRVYLATSDSETTLKKLRRNPRTRRLSAVRAGRFAIVDARLLRPGPRIGDGLLELARALHPSAFR